MFSDKKYPTLKVPEEADEVDATPAYQKASDWIWDETYQRYRYHDGNEWVWKEDSGEGSGTRG